MKIILRFTMLALAVTAVSASCEKDDPVGPDAKTVSIPDAVFRDFCVNGAAGSYGITYGGYDLKAKGGNGDRKIQYREIKDVVYVDLRIAGVTEVVNLTGIGSFTSLNRLNCRGNALASLDVSTNAALTDLNCRGNFLSMLDLSGNAALTKLDCQGNAIGELELSDNTSLTELNCTGNRLSVLNLSANTALKEVYVADQTTDGSAARQIVVVMFPDWETSVTESDLDSDNVTVVIPE